MRIERFLSSHKILPLPTQDRCLISRGFTAAQSIWPCTSAQVNVNVPGIGNERKHKWWVWLIVSVVGFSFLVSCFYVTRGLVVYRKRARARIAAARERAALFTGDLERGQPAALAEEPKVGLFKFWDTDSMQLDPNLAVDNPFRADWRSAAQISAEDEAKMRQHGIGTAAAALRRKECMYRMGQPAKPNHVLRSLQRHNSL